MHSCWIKVYIRNGQLSSMKTNQLQRVDGRWSGKDDTSTVDDVCRLHWLTSRLDCVADDASLMADNFTNDGHAAMRHILQCSTQAKLAVKTKVPKHSCLFTDIQRSSNTKLYSPQYRYSKHSNVSKRDLYIKPLSIPVLTDLKKIYLRSAGNFL